MTSIKGTWILVALTAALVVACGTGPGDSGQVADEEEAEQLAASYVNPGASEDEVFQDVVPAEMTGAWTLVAIDGAPVADVGKTPTVEILEDGSVSGVGGVNRFQCRLEIFDGRLSFGPAAATKMAGPPEAMELESTYLARLGAVSSFALEDGTLRLWAGDNEALTFKRREDADGGE